MPKCGVCGGGIANTLIPHGVICQDTERASKKPKEPRVGMCGDCLTPLSDCVHSYYYLRQEKRK